jgi:hypothetical protein
MDDLNTEQNVIYVSLLSSLPFSFMFLLGVVPDLNTQMCKLSRCVDRVPCPPVFPDRDISAFYGVIFYMMERTLGQVAQKLVTVYVAWTLDNLLTP